jgi:hypothetical protein
MQEVKTRLLPLLLSAAAALAAVLLAAAVGRADGPIEDNSFLIEEAYNQERGVVQHVGTFERPDEGSDWAASFTQEWPAPAQRHQLSFTIPVARIAGESGAGDVALHYRYQLLGSDGGDVALAPRLSLVLPTGDEGEGLGAGAPGLEVNLPVSARLAERWVGHWNLGGSWTPDAAGPGGAEADASSVHVGQGLVFLAAPRFNVLLEAVWGRGEVPAGAGQTESEESFVIAPGVRFAIDRPSGLQIVPGIALPIGVGPSRGELSVFLYLSFEHPF